MQFHLKSPISPLRVFQNQNQASQFPQLHQSKQDSQYFKDQKTLKNLKKIQQLKNEVKNQTFIQISAYIAYKSQYDSQYDTKQKDLHKRYAQFEHLQTPQKDTIQLYCQNKNANKYRDAFYELILQFSYMKSHVKKLLNENNKHNNYQDNSSNGKFDHKKLSNFLMFPQRINQNQYRSHQGLKKFIKRQNNYKQLQEQLQYLQYVQKFQQTQQKTLNSQKNIQEFKEQDLRLRFSIATNDLISFFDDLIKQNSKNKEHNIQYKQTYVNTPENFQWKASNLEREIKQKDKNIQTKLILKKFLFDKQQQIDELKRLSISEQIMKNKIIDLLINFIEDLYLYNYLIFCYTINEKAKQKRSDINNFVDFSETIDEIFQKQLKNNLQKVEKENELFNFQTQLFYFNRRIIYFSLFQKIPGLPLKLFKQLKLYREQQDQKLCSKNQLFEFKFASVYQFLQKSESQQWKQKNNSVNSHIAMFKKSMFEFYMNQLVNTQILINNIMKQNEDQFDDLNFSQKKDFSKQNVHFPTVISYKDLKLIYQKGKRKYIIDKQKYKQRETKGQRDYLLIQPKLKIKDLCNLVKSNCIQTQIQVKIQALKKQLLAQKQKYEQIVNNKGFERKQKEELLIKYQTNKIIFSFLQKCYQICESLKNLNQYQIKICLQEFLIDFIYNIYIYNFLMTCLNFRCDLLNKQLLHQKSFHDIFHEQFDNRKEIIYDFFSIQFTQIKIKKFWQLYSNKTNLHTITSNIFELDIQSIKNCANSMEILQKVLLGQKLLSILDKEQCLLYVKYCIHFSQYAHEIVSDLSSAENISLDAVFNCIRFIEIYLILKYTTEIKFKTQRLIRHSCGRLFYKYFLKIRSQDSKWMDCQRKAKNAVNQSYDKIQNYIKLAKDPRQRQKSANVAKTHKLMIQEKEMMNFILSLHTDTAKEKQQQKKQPQIQIPESQIIRKQLLQFISEFKTKKEADQKKQLHRKIFKTILQLMAQQYLNIKIMQKTYSKLSKKIFSKQFITFTDFLTNNAIKFRSEFSDPKRQKLMSTFQRQFCISVIETVKLFNLIITLPFYTFETERQNQKIKERRKLDENAKRKEPKEIYEIVRTLDLFYIYRAQRLNTQYLIGRGDRNNQIREVYLNYIKYTRVVLKFFTQTHIDINFTKDQLKKLLKVQPQQNRLNLEQIQTEFQYFNIFRRNRIHSQMMTIFSFETTKQYIKIINQELIKYKMKDLYGKLILTCSMNNPILNKLKGLEFNYLTANKTKKSMLSVKRQLIINQQQQNQLDSENQQVQNKLIVKTKSN